MKSSRLKSLDENLNFRNLKDRVKSQTTILYVHRTFSPILYLVYLTSRACDENVTFQFSGTCGNFSLLMNLRVYIDSPMRIHVRECGRKFMPSVSGPLDLVKCPDRDFVHDILVCATLHIHQCHTQQCL